ncbi:hypothetical protein ACLI4Y_14830 [Natrialbaceae archaeon A-CW3]
MRFTREATVKGAIVAGGFLVATALLTGLLPNPRFDRIVPRTGMDVVFLLLTTLLLGVYTAQRSTRVDCSGFLLGCLGALGGYIAVSCPYCLPGIEDALSPSMIATYLVPTRPIVGVASVALLAGVITARQRRLVIEGPAVSGVDLRCPTCGALLKTTANEPDPEFVEGRMQMEVTCPGCDDVLVVLVEATTDDGLEIRKRVERKSHSSGRESRANPYSLAPVDDPDERE